MTLSPTVRDQPASWESQSQFPAEQTAATPGWRITVGSIVASGTFADRVILAVALAGGSFLRLWEINAIGLNSDEAVYAGQAAAIAGQPALTPFFPIFRAHPLLYQFVLALILPLSGLDRVDIAGRLLSAAVGVATVVLVFLCGRQLYGQRVGVVAALFMAIMPYSVVVSRQILLDGPMALCASLTLYCLIRFGSSRNVGWFYAAGAAMGLTMLAKETAIILVGAIYVFLALTPELRVRIRDLVVSLACMIAVVMPFPLSLQLAKGSGSQIAHQYLVWQLFRRPNHGFSFYPTTVPWAIGPLLLVAALLGFWVLRRNLSWRERLLAAWIVIPCVFFQFWPVKGFQYLLPVAAPVAILAARTVVHWRPQTTLNRPLLSRVTRHLNLFAISIAAASIAVPAWQNIHVQTSTQFLAGTGGVPGGREAGTWFEANTPQGSTIMTIGPSMANILEFYGRRRAYGLSVSTNPLHRNPAYDPIRNPDAQLRNGNIQYIVWDAFSSERSTSFADKVIAYAQKYHGRIEYTETIPVSDSHGATVDKPFIVVWAVHP